MLDISVLMLYFPANTPLYRRTSLRDVRFAG